MQAQAGSRSVAWQTPALRARDSQDGRVEKESQARSTHGREPQHQGDSHVGHDKGSGVTPLCLSGKGHRSCD